MKLRAIFSASIVALVLTLCYSLPAFATANVKLVYSAGGTYQVLGTDLVNIAGIDLTITYDSSALGNPKVVAGGLVAGSMFVPNAGNPGIIRLAIISTNPTKTFQGSGTIATVTFERKGGAVANNPTLNVSFTNADLNAAAVTPQVVNSSDPAPTSTPPPTSMDTSSSTATTASTPNTSNTPTTVSGSVTNQPIIVGGSLTMPTDTPQVPEKISPPATPEYREEPRNEAPSIARETVAAEAKQQEPPPAKKLESQKSVLNRFRDYKGELTVKELLALFDRDEKSAFRQEPAVLLADGKAVLKVTIAAVEGKTAPNFALKGARLVSLSKSSENYWIVEARPENKVSVATLTMLLDDSIIELPLTVAPKVDPDLDKSGKITEDDFKLFLKERGTEKAPKYDLDGDGKRDYVDDYIFAANYLAQLEKQPKAKTPESKPKEKAAESKPALKSSEGIVKEKK